MASYEEKKYKVLPRKDCYEKPNGKTAKIIYDLLEKRDHVAPVRDIVENSMAGRNAMESLILHRHVIKTTAEHAFVMCPSKYTASLVGYPAKHAVLISCNLWTKVTDVFTKKFAIEKVDEIIDYLERKNTFIITPQFMALQLEEPKYPELWNFLSVSEKLNNRKHV